MSWYKKWFEDPVYLTLYSHRDEYEAIKMLDLIVKILNPSPNIEILDLACGNGRHTIELCKRGYHVTGIDLSQNLLDIALSKSKENNLQINFLRRDMRELEFNNQFDIVLNLFTSFGYFDKDDENEKCIANISNALKSNGWFILDYFNSDHVIFNLNEDKIFKNKDTTICQKKVIVNNRINKYIEIIENDKKREYIESVRMYSKNDFVGLLKKNRLMPIYFFGDYDGNEFTINSERLIIFSKKS